MPKKLEVNVASLVKEGYVGTALGALLTTNNELGGLANAAVAASLEAYKNAKETKVPLMVEEDNVLYEIRANGAKKKIKYLSSSTHALPKHFDLT